MNDKRVADVPDAPTLAEIGVPNANLANVRAFFIVLCQLYFMILHPTV